LVSLLGVSHGEVLELLPELLEGVVDVVLALGAGEDDLAGAEDEDGLDGPEVLVDDAWEVLVADDVLLATEAGDLYPEADVCVGDDVGDAEGLHLGLEAKDLGDVLGGLAGCALGVALGLGADDDHPARGEAQDGALGHGLAHDHRREPLVVVPRALDLLRNHLQVQLPLDLHLRE